MRKTMKKVLAVVLCLSVLLTIAPIAFAVSAEEDGGYNFKGVYRIKQGESLTIDVPSTVLDAYDFGAYVEYEGIATVSEIENGQITIYADSEGWGATPLCFDMYDEEGWWIDSFNYVVFVYSEDDAQMTGRVTDITVYDARVKCETNDNLDYDVDAEGDISWDYLVYYDGYGIDVDYDGEFYAYDRGEVEGILYAIDTNGNIVSDSFTITSTFTVWQWVKYIVRSIVDFLFGWAYNN